MNQSQSKSSKSTDFKRFLFLATGRDTDIRKITLLDVADNVYGELDRLKAVAALLRSLEDEIEPEIASGLGSLILDCCRRAETVLELALEGKGKKG